MALTSKIEPDLQTVITAVHSILGTYPNVLSTLHVVRHSIAVNGIAGTVQKITECSFMDAHLAVDKATR